MEKAVIDRIEDGNITVILVGESETEVHVQKDKLPDGAKEGSHILVEVAGGEVVKIELDNGSSLSAQERMNKKMELLRKKSKK